MKMDAGFRIDIIPEENVFIQPDGESIIPKKEGKKVGAVFPKKHVRHCSKTIKIAKQNSTCSKPFLWVTSVKFANITNFFLLCGCITCVVYVALKYKLQPPYAQNQGLVGLYYFERNVCNRINKTCQTLPWTVQNEDVSTITYNPVTRKINLLKPGSYLISLHLSLQSSNYQDLLSNADIDKHTGVICIKTALQERCTRFNVANKQADIFHVIKVQNETQTFWVNYDNWQNIYRVQKLNTMTVVKV